MEIKETAYQSLFNLLGKNDTQNVFTPPRLIRRMLSRIKFDSDSKIFVWYNVEFLTYLVKEIGLSPKNIYIYTNSQDKLILKKQGYHVCFQKDIDYNKLDEQIVNMKFDVIIGNPPFQDGKKTGGQNKIYLDTGHWGPTEDPVILHNPNGDLVITHNLYNGKISYKIKEKT